MLVSHLEQTTLCLHLPWWYTPHGSKPPLKPWKEAKSWRYENNPALWCSYSPVARERCTADVWGNLSPRLGCENVDGGQFIREQCACRAALDPYLQFFWLPANSHICREVCMDPNTYGMCMKQGKVKCCPLPVCATLPQVSASSWWVFADRWAVGRNQTKAITGGFWFEESLVLFIPPKYF